MFRVYEFSRKKIAADTFEIYFWTSLATQISGMPPLANSHNNESLQRYL